MEKLSNLKLGNAVITGTTLEDVKKDADKATLHHTSTSKGYVSTKTEGIITPYNGRYGKGYKLKSHNPNSTKYCLVSYYIMEAEQ